MSIIEGTHYIYTVRPGDTLYAIARQTRSTVQAIEEANTLRPPITASGLIHPGQVLVIPSSVQAEERTLYIIQPGDTLYRIGEQYAVHPDLIVGLNPGIAQPNLIFPDQAIWLPLFVYEVQSGDSLFSISRRLGIPLSVILQTNQNRIGFSPDLIYPGFRLLLPHPSVRNLTVLRPYPGEKIASGHKLEGFARVFEANVLYQVRDDQQTIVTNERFTTASAGAPAYGYFTDTIQFDQDPQTAAGELWVYTRSARDGSIQDLTEVKVFF